MALAAELEEAGEHRLAFEVQSRIPATGPQAVSGLGWSYHYLRRWKGEDAALEWLRPRLKALSPRDQALLACVGYDSRDYDLLWEVDYVGPERIHSDFHWLMRAAASVRIGAARDPHRTRLERHFARPRPEHYFVLGRFLLGREDGETALSINRYFVEHPDDLGPEVALRDLLLPGPQGRERRRDPRGGALVHALDRDRPGVQRRIPVGIQAAPRMGCPQHIARAPRRRGEAQARAVARGRRRLKTQR